MKIEKTNCSYQVTECDLKFGEELLIPISTINKIRTEISNDIHRCNNTDMAFGMQHTLDVIDKYREVKNE